MGYMNNFGKIPNLYKCIDVLMFREVYAMEKIHGTSANVRLKQGELLFFSGGEKHDRFVSLFDQEALLKKLLEIFGDQTDVTIYGEAYGGKQQGMSATYGKELKFVAFEVRVDDNWLAVPQAHDVVDKLGLEFVYYEKGPATLEWLNSQRDADSAQAKRNGIEEPRKREGVVIRPLVELTKNNGSRVIAKHKRDEFKETKTPREVDPEKLKVLEEAKAIADEWVVAERLRHVLQKLETDGQEIGMERTKDVIKAMIEDIKIEGEGEIVWSKEASKAIGKRTAILFKKHVQDRMREKASEASQS